MKILSLIICIFLFHNLFAKENKANKVNNDENKKVIYTYKQFEKFDFDDLNIEAEAGAPNDLSVSPIHEKRYSNRLPYRKTFTTEIRKGVERVR